MKLFPAKCHERATLLKLWRRTGNSSLLPAVARDRWNFSAVFKFCFCFILLYNKSLNDWSLGEQWILFPSNLNVSLDFVSGKIEILGKQTSLFPSVPDIKCLLLGYHYRYWEPTIKQLSWPLLRLTWTLFKLNWVLLRLTWTLFGLTGVVSIKGC